MILAFVWKACCKNDINFMHTQSFKIKQIFQEDFVDTFCWVSVQTSSKAREGKGKEDEGMGKNSYWTKR